MIENSGSLLGPPALVLEPIVRRALEEDLGRRGDLTSDALIPADLEARATVCARERGTIAGLGAVSTTFGLFDSRIEGELVVRDGQRVPAEDVLLTVRGAARSILAAERTALNFLGHLSGIATATAEIVAEVEGTGCRVVCTRKTTPGLRVLEKHAVLCGGGANHRFGLDDGVLIKDNHRVIAGGAVEAVRRAREAVGHMVKIEVEVEELAVIEAVIELGVDAVLLDNMSVSQLTKAVEIVDGRATTEASGRVTIANAAAIAKTGVDLISVGWLTHSSPSLDVSLEIEAA